MQAQNIPITDAPTIAPPEAAATELQDGAGASATILSFGDFAAIERPDTATSNGQVFDWAAYDNDFLLAA